MFKGVKRVLCGGIDKRCSYAFLLILCGFLLSTKMTTPEMTNYRARATAYPTKRAFVKGAFTQKTKAPDKLEFPIKSIQFHTNSALTFQFQDLSKYY